MELDDKLEKVCLWKQISNEVFIRFKGDSYEKCQKRCVGYDTKCEGYAEFDNKYMEIKNG